MVATILLYTAITVLAACVVYFLILGIKALKDRVINYSKQKRQGQVAYQKSKAVMAEAMKIVAEQETPVTLAELETLFGEDGVVEAVVNTDGTVNPDDIHILNAEKMEEPLSNYMDQHNGTLVIEIP